MLCLFLFCTPQYVNQAFVLGRKIILHLMLLPSLFKTNTSILIPATSGGSKKFWKPSLAESRDGFILHVKVILIFFLCCVTKSQWTFLKDFLSPLLVANPLLLLELATILWAIMDKFADILWTQ